MIVILFPTGPCSGPCVIQVGAILWAPVLHMVWNGYIMFLD